MLHHSNIKKLGRERKVRRGLMRSLAHNLILEEKMITTEAKAKALRPFVERLVTIAKNDTVANKRLIAGRLGNDTQATTKLFAELGPRFKERPGGYVRIVKVGTRAGDGATKAFIGFV
jgi:large subunit ribosomal protein L17